MEQQHSVHGRRNNIAKRNLTNAAFRFDEWNIFSTWAHVTLRPNKHSDKLAHKSKHWNQGLYKQEKHQIPRIFSIANLNEDTLFVFSLLPHKRNSFSEAKENGREKSAPINNIKANHIFGRKIGNEIQKWQWNAIDICDTLQTNLHGALLACRTTRHIQQGISIHQQITIGKAFVRRSTARAFTKKKKKRDTYGMVYGLAWSQYH